MKLTHYLILAAAALSLGSCNSGGSEAVAYYTDIVTLDATNSGGSVLTFQVLNDSPLVTLTTNAKLSESYVGKRIVVIYSPVGTLKHGVSGQVNLVEAGLTFGGGAAPLNAVVDSLDNWSSDEVRYMQAYRSGRYLNLGMTLPTTAMPEKFQCYLDVTTADSEYPELHVVFKAKPGYDSQTTNFFGSYDIAALSTDRVSRVSR